MQKEKTKKSTEWEIRDNRGNKRFFIDDVFHDVYAKVVGPYGQAVYMSLCRHADKKQKAWPGIETMATNLGIGRKSVFAGLEILEFLKIIKKDRVGKKCTNRYTLLDRSKWMKSGGVKFPTDTSQKMSEVPLRYFSSSSGELHKFLGGTSIVRKHREGNTVKDCEANASRPLNCFKEGCIKKAMKDKRFCEEHQQMDLKQFIIWCSKGQKHIQIIGEWAETIEKDLRTVAQWEEFINRNLKIARKLVPFDRDQLEAGFEKIEEGIKRGWLTDYSLETLYKKVTNAK
ncbi:TPA: hypothetical protein DIC62_01440 [Candidatus Nomurabacteria bacterium]|nr:hypothetical protein [Candidatus Nomurabacteria bacterium]